MEKVSLRSYKTLHEKARRQNAVLMFIKEKLKEISPRLKKIKAFTTTKKRKVGKNKSKLK